MSTPDEWACDRIALSNMEVASPKLSRFLFLEKGPPSASSSLFLALTLPTF